MGRKKNAHRRVAVGEAGLAALLLAGSALATQAWVSAGQANIRLQPSAASPIIGRLEKGDRVELADGGDAPNGWTLLEPMGAVRTWVLDPETSSEFPPAEYVYARVIVPLAAVRAEPDTAARVVDRQPRGHILALRGSQAPGAPWLQRPDGTFLARSDVKPLAGSSFRGVHDPPPDLAFVTTRVQLQPIDSTNGEVSVLERYTALPVLAVVGKRVRTEQGMVPRSAVRLARAVQRPSGIGPEARWIDVDTAEQVLTAYEGDRLVFATLVSTGKKGWETPTGHFRVWYKLRHGAMRGHRASYLVEEVPHSLFFGGDTAIHGVTWHDKFGRAVSHGCINLSPEDAAWLFEWAPPALPDGWHGILPGGAGLESLWIVVESSDRKRTVTQVDVHGAG